MDELKREASDEPRDRSRDRRDYRSSERRNDRTRDRRRDRSSERNSDQSDNERDKKRDSASAREKASDPYWYPGKGKFSHLTKMPTQNPHDPRPRNPKRTHSCRSEPSGQRHARLERKHDRRQDEREALKNGALTPPPGAGPNWAKNREATLAKYAKAANRRHKKHEKRMRKAAEQEAKP